MKRMMPEVVRAAKALKPSFERMNWIIKILPVELVPNEASREWFRMTPFRALLRRGPRMDYMALE